MPDKETAAKLYEMGQALIEMAKMYGYDEEGAAEESMMEESEPMAEESAPAPARPKQAIIIALKKKMGKGKGDE